MQSRFAASFARRAKDRDVMASTGGSQSDLEPGNSRADNCNAAFLCGGDERFELV
jgi:hypothetical protein